MHEPFTVSEDSTIREIKSQKEKKRMRPMLPRVAAAGFGICLLVVIAINQAIGLDFRTFILCILVPTPMMLLLLWVSPLISRYADSKWTIKEKKIQMSDGFYIPEKAYHMWNYSLSESTECEGYKVVALRNSGGILKKINLKDPELLDRLVAYLKDKGVNQSIEEQPIQPPHD